ncbi:MAG: aldolase/citrate lyase family protein [Bacteroidota bacterium]
MKNFSSQNSNLKRKLKNLDLTIGTWLTIPNQSVVEVLSTGGFDWITIDLEHSAIDKMELQNLIGHIQGNNLEALVRVHKNDEVVIKHSLDAGANGIIVPMIKNSEDAQNAVNFAKYPPSGQRGVGLFRAQNYGIGFEEYVDWLNNDLIIIAQIEHIEAVNNLNEILNVKGIDGILVGPYDLSASMGIPGEFENIKVVESIKEIEEITISSGKSLGVHVVSSDCLKVVDKIMKKYNFIAFGIDFLFLGDKIRNEMQALKDMQNEK